MTVPYYRPPRPNTQRLGNMVKKLADSKMITNGAHCRELEDNVRDMHGSKYALSCSSGTTGLIIALKALKHLTGAKDVYLPSFTWPATEFAVEAAQMNRLFVDVDPHTWHMQPSGEDNQISMPVSTFGAQVDPSRYKGTILVDGAHMLGVPIKFDSVAGVIISMAPTKLLTCGEGGMLLTSSSELAAEFERMRNNFGRMSEANAAMGLCHWEGIHSYMKDRHKRWGKYALHFKRRQRFTVSNHSTFAARIENRKKFMDFMTSKGVETRSYYQPLVGGLKNTDKIADEVVCLPNWYGCPDMDIVKALEEYSKDPI